MMHKNASTMWTAPSAAPPARQRQHRCRAEPPLTPAQQASRDAVEARIRKARQYKKADQGQAAGAAQPAAAAAVVAPPPPPPPPQQAATPTPQSSSGQAPNVEQTFAQAAQQQAAKEEAQFLQAISQTSPSSGSTIPSSSNANSSSPSAKPSVEAAGTSREAILARMAAARSYKQPASTSPEATATTASASPAAPAAPAGTAGSSASVPASATSPQPPPALTQQQQQQEEAEQQRSFRTGSGGAEQAANWLQFAENGRDDTNDAPAAPIDPSLSAEQFTLAKEAQKKQQRVEIITADASWVAQARFERAAARQAQQAGGEAGVVEQEEGEEAAEAESEEDMHKPKVATWGVFPRPRNISEAYGGGRTLRPGQALEPEAAGVEREERIKRSMAEYRKSLGLDVEPEVEAEAQALYDEGNALFDQGLISLALPKFAAASELMALRSRLGGEARLQQAICLDSLGQNQEAYDIYKGIQTHPAPGVAKKAKRMLFGWKAAGSLKTGRLSYQPSTDQWKRYFDPINQNACGKDW